MPTSRAAALRRQATLTAALAAVFGGVIAVPGCGGPAGPDAATPQAAEPESDESIESIEGITATELAARLTAVYRQADRYVDNAEYHERSVRREEGVESVQPPHLVSVALERPDRLRVTRNVGSDFEVVYATDGSRTRVTNSDYPDQVVDLAPPAGLSPGLWGPGDVIGSMVLPVPLENLYPQLDLLLATDETPPQLFAGAALTLLPSDELDDRPCYRLRIDRAQGVYIAWIDRETTLLRRLEMPTAEVRRQLDPRGELARLDLWIDFVQASIETPIGAQAFVLQPSEGAELVATFEAPPGTPATGGDQTQNDAAREARPAGNP